jgi:hypothetical protein
MKHRAFLLAGIAALFAVPAGAGRAGIVITGVGVGVGVGLGVATRGGGKFGSTGPCARGVGVGVGTGSRKSDTAAPAGTANSAAMPARRKARCFM